MINNDSSLVEVEALVADAPSNTKILATLSGGGANFLLLKETCMRRIAFGALCALMTNPLIAELGDGWGHYAGNERALQYSSATQINISNVSSLKEAWRFRTGEMGEGSAS